MKNQIKENERVKKAYEKENEFLKNEVMDQDSITGEDNNKQNNQTTMEKTIEKGEAFENNK